MYSESMIKPLLLVSTFILPLSAQQAAPAQNAAPPAQQSRRLEFTPVARQSVETRLRQAGAGERAATLKSIFEQAGCKGDQLKSEEVKKFGSNVVCVLKGDTDSVIVAGAHFDGKGVVDNWTGASLLPSLFESLSKTQHKHTFVFVGFTGKGNGLEGAQAYVKGLSNEERGRIKAELNLDSLGLSQTKVWAEGSDKKLTAILAAVGNALKTPVMAAPAPENGDDSRAFAKEKIATLCVHSVTPDTQKLLQSAQDNVEAVHMDEYYETYRLLCAYMAYLDGAIE
jgi:putative aminopeptidase FrvX